MNDLLRITGSARSGADTPVDQQAYLLSRGSEDVFPRGGLAEKLLIGRPLRIKLGLDPTAPDVHLGHSVVLRRLREFQDFGHTVVLIIGDFTARIGDPTGRSKTRPQLGDAAIDRAADTYADQVFRVLDPARTELRRNSEWLDMATTELFHLLKSTTVAQLLARDDFANRLASHTPISALELLYPLMQGYDSVAVSADVELGGTDQTFNLLLARDVQRHYGTPEQVCLTMPILTGTDGHQKMSKSLGNHIGLTEPAKEMFGRTMSIPDDRIGEWERLLFDHFEPDDKVVSPLQRKRRLGRSIAERFCGDRSGAEAEISFDQVFRDHQTPQDIPSLTLPGGDIIHLPALLEQAFEISRAQARRELGSGAVRIDGAKTSAHELNVPSADLDGRVLSIGKRRFCRLSL